MTEIRPIRADEAERFLRLLCDVFDLDLNRARSIFYNEPLFDLSHKWSLFENGEPVSIMTTVPLTFGWGQAVGIAGVATHRQARGLGHASTLMQHVLDWNGERNVRAAFLFARDMRIYQKFGFEHLDDAVYAPILGRPEFILPRTLSFEETCRAYTKWSEEEPNRLRRDDRRWSYWKWNLRVCSAHTTGYLCLEGNIVRECVPGGGESPWPVPNNTEWFGLNSMAKSLGVPIRDPRSELKLMGYRAPGVPQMFMTDQF